MTKTPEYKSWSQMLVRCRNPDDPRWKYYGGRGIEVKFASFEEFFAEVGPRPPASPTEGRYSIHRIDNDGNYEKGNVKWATWKEQCAPGNKRPSSLKKQKQLRILRRLATKGEPPKKIYRPLSHTAHTWKFLDYINRTYGRNVYMD